MLYCDFRIFCSIAREIIKLISKNPNVDFLNVIHEQKQLRGAGVNGLKYEILHNLYYFGDDMHLQKSYQIGKLKKRTDHAN